MSFDAIKNPVWDRCDNLRDPAVYRAEDGTYHLFYSRYSNGDWTKPENWSIAQVTTRDFITFENDRDISPKGYASPGDLIRLNGRYVLPYQSYPEVPTMLCYSVSEDLRSWSDPVPFLPEALELPWNKAKRVIDPCFVRDGDRLHCFFVGTDRETWGFPVNLVGHAFTEDMTLMHWTITTTDAPLIGVGERNTDGAENVTVYPVDDRWGMIFSEGLVHQHLAYAEAEDLIHWEIRDRVELAEQPWMSVRYGAPYVWREEDGYRMILMGENDRKHTTFGLLTSQDGLHWALNPAKSDLT